MEMKRPVLLTAVILIAGCSTYREVPRHDLTPETPVDRVRVATLDGFEYEFDRALVSADTLYGYFEVTEERTGPARQVYYEDALRLQGIPLARVARLELVRKDPVRTALWVASIGAAGYFLVNLVEESSNEPRLPGGGGKPSP